MVASTRWVLAILGVVLLSTLAVFTLIGRRESEPEFVPEIPNVGVGIAPVVPLDRPLSATLFLTAGTGEAGNPYNFCVISALWDGRPSCLFNVLLVGEQGRIEPLAWYHLTASFAEGLPEIGVGGRLMSVSPTAVARVAGLARVRQSRFHEDSEALSNWAVAHSVNGYLRTDGIYVWHLNGEAAEAANGLALGPVIATWTAPG